MIVRTEKGRFEVPDDGGFPRFVVGKVKNCGTCLFYRDGKCHWLMHRVRVPFWAQKFPRVAKSRGKDCGVYQRADRHLTERNRYLDSAEAPK